jgi:hypothetical protein|tara:strand:+ start:130 stop:1005 length:876 start_codon:yes stop_codon:yes gene_type:complete
VEPEARYQGKNISPEQIDFINELIRQNPGDSRRRLSKKLCEAWNWVQPNGVLKDMFCRSLMLSLHRQGHIRLPEKKRNPANPLADRRAPRRVEVNQSPIEDELKAIGPVEIQQVRRTAAEKLYDGLIAQYHYLGYRHLIGEHLKYVAYAQGRAIACFGWSSGVRHLGPRDRFIGWNPTDRMKNLHLVAYNSRFLIVPWVQVKHLASHLLRLMARRLATDWQEIYNHPICLLETFVDRSRFQGVSYQAANWIYLGLTTGRGKNDQTNRPNRSLKAVWCYPLCKNFREVMQRE